MAVRQRSNSVLQRFTENEVARYKQVFLHFDVDGNGHIDEQELQDIMHRLGRTLGPGEAAELIKLVDTDNSGVIYFEEFLQLLELQRDDAVQTAQMRETFNVVFNRSGTGLMTREELRNGMVSLGHRLSDEEVDDMLYEADEDEDSRISFEEFATILKRCKMGGRAVNKRGWEHQNHDKMMEYWGYVLEETPKVAEKNSMVNKCQRPVREFRNPSRSGEPKVRKIGGDQKSLQPTINSCHQNEIIEVSHGVFSEPIIINIEGLVIRGTDPDKKPKIEVNSKNPAVTLRCKRAFLENFEVVNHGAGPAIQVEMGFPDLIGLSVKGVNGGLQIRNRSHPLVQNCHFHDSQRAWGISVKESRAIIENCSFSGNSDGGVVVERSSNPWISNCKFIKGKGCGLVFLDTTSGVVCNCDIAENGCAGIFIINGANPILWKNEIHHGQAAGMSVQNGGRGIAEENEFHDNEAADIEIIKQGNPLIRRNKIHSGKGSGISVEDGGLGVLEENEIRDYSLAGVYIGKGGNPQIIENVIFAPENIGGTCGVHLAEGASGKVVDNMLVGWVVQPRASLVHGIPIHVSGKNETYIHGNIARRTEEECSAEKMVHMMGKHSILK